ncbi:unnamed protein product [Oncorhynchus mykiss]|uniref:Uncharacterized protein n=1 Tax=Oncorhynchus mykiss TaxID=8022 RepID=A0A061A4D3_ONCMY|nr:unnamed protein product [Oncorhynchus mykiss]
MNPDAQLPEVYPSAADLYQRELTSLQQQSPDGSLSHPELLVAVEMLSSVVLINRALDVGDRNSMWRQLASAVTGLSNVEDEYAQRYMDELMRLKAVAREEGSDYLTWNDIQACVDQVNLTIQEEHEREWTTHLHAHVQTCTQTHVRTHAGTHMHILARMHVHTHTHTHSRTLLPRLVTIK